MVVTLSIEEFHSHNHLDLIRFLHFKNIYNPQIIEDITQAFYLRLSERPVLAQFDPARGTFEAYIMRCLSNVMSDYFNADPVTIGLSEIDGCRETSDVAGRILDFKSWIEKHAGKASDKMLECLQARIRGDELSESLRTTYYRYLKIYLTQESGDGL